MEEFLLVINGKPEGPFIIEELKKRNLKPGDFVKTPEMEDYKEAQEIAALRKLFGFSRPYVIPQYFGAFDQRLLASVIDWLTITGICTVPAFFIVLLSDAKIFNIIFSTSLLVVIPLLYTIYHIVMESGPKQGTYGKQLLNIKVTDLYGERITRAQAVSRNISKILCVITLGVGYLLSFFNKKQQCLHDMVAGTLVVKDRLI
ncbi:RDD family protein [Mucilaginibacter sp. KACC 22063]|uniref:RDD family protein n=1 Tax=Mucilaginibacter sp. KACC 22063 TaxID=3025666 RepID=UPI0023655981|nr:RDD family protein [Mucilaginibacter sp. KACC 22063]WDF54567.1 RDD family protein [Mucilaginibacter sp. KACC 22063]